VKSERRNLSPTPTYLLQQPTELSLSFNSMEPTWP
jgi:hypothetical protein